MLTVEVQTGQNITKAANSLALTTHATGEKKMSKKDFETKCRELEALGYTATEYEPYSKYAVYQLNGMTRIVGKKK